MRSVIFVMCAVSVVACDKEKTATITGPGLTAMPPSASGVASASTPPPMIPPSVVASAPPSASNPGPPMNGPPSAIFAEVTAAKSLPIRITGCDEVVFTFVRGKGNALGETLGTSDVMLVRGTGNVEVKGDGTLVVGRVMPKECTPLPAQTKKVVRASTKDLAWAGGTMHAHLDLEGDTAAGMYVGRLEGTAPVAEHTHAGTWEILCAIEGEGAFVMGGRAQRLGPHQIVVVPPDTPHAWKPDAGKKLVAVQMYAPPGPEQRFRKLAADAADAGKP